MLAFGAFLMFFCWFLVLTVLKVFLGKGPRDMGLPVFLFGHRGKGVYLNHWKDRFQTLGYYAYWFLARFEIQSFEQQN